LKCAAADAPPSTSKPFYLQQPLYFMGKNPALQTSALAAAGSGLTDSRTDAAPENTPREYGDQTPPSWNAPMDTPRAL
jgi:hypothetical protein